ncbi:MAG: preprotein translocase subunit SecG [Gammaproteobacteria bacterium]|nr:preprotein translocase subunit SecG [Gammaproteobacteria bacterium]
MYQVLLIVQLLVAFALIALILLQQGRGADAGASFGGGTSGSLFGSRGPATFLAKITALLATVFFLNSIGLAYITTQSVERRSVIERFQDDQPGSDTPVIPQNAGQDVPEPMESGADSGPVSDVPTTPESQEGRQEY